MSDGDLREWTIRARPDMPSLRGRFVDLRPANFPDDAEGLFAAIGGPSNADLWTYIPFGPPESAEALGAIMPAIAQAQGWQTHLLCDPQSSKIQGMASFMRIRPEAGSAEIGCINFSKALQKTPAATEAMYLMARHLFDELGYRRYEWKCDNANLASRGAANRLGFQFEGVFRQDLVVKGRNRDTAWYSIVDKDWKSVKAAFEAWLDPGNFNDAGEQISALAQLRLALVE